VPGDEGVQYGGVADVGLLCVPAPNARRRAIRCKSSPKTAPSFPLLSLTRNVPTFNSSSVSRTFHCMSQKHSPEQLLNLPDHVREYMRKVFAAANHYVSNLYSATPNMHEEWLDGSLIHRLREWSSPVRLDAGWIVEVATHYLGGRRHFMNWEVADIGLLIVTRERGVIKKVKAAVLQSKRLYPDEVPEIDEQSVEDYEIGFAKLLPADGLLSDILAPRIFTFREESKYRALKVSDNQWDVIQSYEGQNIPVHYLLYNPTALPSSIRLPHDSSPVPQDVVCGAHVLRAIDIRNACANQAKGYSPSYSDLHGSDFWSLENFVADELLKCREGFLTTKDSPNLRTLFYRRSGPISAAISVTIDVPTGG